MNPPVDPIEGIPYQSCWDLSRQADDIVGEAISHTVFPKYAPFRLGGIENPTELTPWGDFKYHVLNMSS